MNEEEVKVRIILPWLQERGLSPEELDLETSFSIRIGTNDVVIGGRRGKVLQQARLDILVKRRGVNLLVIEVKRPSEILAGEDRDQAVSYARLVHPMAPFALVTNGKDFELYDTLTKERITPENARFLEGAVLELPNEARLEALRLFFGVNPENLVLFARAQAERTIAPLLGGPNDLSAVYIPETHVQRQELSAGIRAFLAGPLPLYVLAGESGMGKSCVMVDFARTFAEEGYPVLVFRGALLQGDLLDAIANEVEWAFGAHRGAIDTLRRLAENTGGKPLLIMIDGVEDWSFAARVQNLASVIAHASGLNFRLIVSSKTATWEPFTAILGSRTGIVASTHNATDERSFSELVGPFTPREFFSAVDKHRAAYNVEDGGFDPAALEETRQSPFMLRLAFQVKAAEPRAERPGPSRDNHGRIAFDSAHFFETYLRLAAHRTGQEEIVVNVLVATARILYETDREWVDEQTLRNALGMRITEALPNVLFQQRLLTGVGRAGVRQIGFGFGLLRNYIIAFHVRHWPAMPPDEFARDFVGAGPSSLRAELLSFYYPLATDAQKRIVDAPVRAHAVDYLRKYVYLIDEFPALRDWFAPGTLGQIGFAGELRFAPPRVAMFGFREIAEGDEELLLIPVDASDQHSARLFVAGVESPHYSSVLGGFRTPVSVETIRGGAIANQLESLIRKGRLNEAAVPELAEELIECILLSHDFLSPFIDRKARRVRYPVDLADVMRAVRREFLYRHFRNEVVEGKRRRGEIKEDWRGTIVSYSTNLRTDEERGVMERVEAALTSEEEVTLRAHYTDLERLKERLERALRARTGRPSLLNGPVFPLRNELIDALRTGQTVPLERVKQHCLQALQLAVFGYRRMVETNFPQLIDRFGFCQRGPVRAVLAVDPGFITGSGRTFLAFCESRSSTDEVIVCDLGEARLDLDTDTVVTAEGDDPYLSARWPVIGEFLYGHYRSGMEYDCEGSVLRRLIYGWLNQDFGPVKEWLKGSDAASAP